MNQCKINHIIFQKISSGYAFSDGNKELIFETGNLIDELKRLQKEIDEAKENQRIMLQEEWGRITHEQYSQKNETYNKQKDIIENNQQRIKEIIEQL